MRAEARCWLTFEGEITNQQLNGSQSMAVAGAATRRRVRVACPELPPHLGRRISALPCAPPSSPPPRAASRAARHTPRDGGEGAGVAVASIEAPHQVRAA